MPGSSSKKQAQRTKGNVRPSSSSQAAQLLTSTGAAATGFIGFGTMSGTPGYVPASQALEDVDSSLDAEFRLVLRKLTKKDSTTKVKALQEFSVLCKEKSVEDLMAVLPFWPRMYNRAALDVDHRVRETTQQAMTALVLQVRKHLAPYLRSLMGAWLLCQCDTYPTVAAAATQAFQSAFPPTKQTDVLLFCRMEIVQYFCDNLQNQTAMTLSDPKTTDRDDMDNKYHRVMTSSLYGLRKLLTSIPADQVDTLKDSLDSLLKDSKFWKHGKSTAASVKASMYSFLASMCQVQPELSALYNNKMAPFMLHNLDEKDPVICPAVWEATLSLTNFVKDCWKYVSIDKAFWPKLRTALENGFYGNMALIGSDLLPFISKVPSDILGADSRFYIKFFTHMKLGLSKDTVQNSPSECVAMVRAFLECCQYVIKSVEDVQVIKMITIEQMLPVILASLFEEKSTLHKSPLYSLTGMTLSAMEITGNGESVKGAEEFWAELGDSVTDRLSCINKKTDIENVKFVDRFILLVTNLVYPKSGLKQKTEKVKFSLAADLQLDACQPMEERTRLPPSAEKFIQRITLKSFDRAQKASSSKCLHLFASLVELDPSEDTIRKVIEQCEGGVHGDQSHSTYFVFKVCLPWLEDVTSSTETDPRELLSVLCSFLPLLESDAVTQLLQKLCEVQLNFGAFCYLLEKVLPLQRRFSSIRDWLQQAVFSSKVVDIATQVCQRSLSQERVDDSELQNGWDIISMVLGGDSQANWSVSHELVRQILEIVHQSLLVLKSSEHKHKTDIAVKFVAKATHSFFMNAKSSLLLPSAADLLQTLFSISLESSHDVTGETLQDCEAVWTVGLGAIIKQTGGLLQDHGILSKVIAIVKNRLAKVETLAEFDVLLTKVKCLLSVVEDNIPEDKGENPVLTAIYQDLYVETQLNPSHQVLEHILVEGAFMLADTTKPMVKESALQLMYGTLYNIQLLSNAKHITMETAEPKEAISLEFSDTEQEMLLDILHGNMIVKAWKNIHEKNPVCDQMTVALQRLQSLLSRFIQYCSDKDRNVLVNTVMEKCEGQGHLWGITLQHLLQLLSTDTKFTLNLGILLDRCADLDEGRVQLLQGVAGHLTDQDSLTLCEILVARFISCPLENVPQINGGFGILAALTSTLAIVARNEECVSSGIDLIHGVFTQLLDWKEQDDCLMLMGSNLDEVLPSLVLMNAEIVKFFTLAVEFYSKHLTDQEWDFVMCSLVSMIQSIDESQSSLMTSCITQRYSVSVCRMLTQVALCIQKEVVLETSSYPPNLVTEWNEFFSESAYSTLLPLYIKVLGNQTAAANTVLIKAIGASLAHCPQQQILNHQLPPLFIAGESSPLPNNLQTLLNHLCPLLNHKDRAVQITVFHLLKSVVSELPQYDKETKVTEDNKEETNRSPPAALMKILSNCNVAMEIMLTDVKVDDCFQVHPNTEEHQYTLSYLLTWKLLLCLFRSSPAELRQEYASHFKDTGMIRQLMRYLFCLLPDKPPIVNKGDQSFAVFEVPPDLSVTDDSSSTEIQHVSCWVFSDSLQTMPAMARQWWLEQDRKTSAYIDRFTSKNVSQLLCTEEISSISKSDQKLDYITIRTRPTTREVLVTYALEEVTTEMVITLPQNYPLGSIEVKSEKRVGVSAAQWEKWLLQLRIFLQYQNGSLFDGLRIWKRNVDKRFEGVDDCMICFSVLHGTNYQLPRLQCKTCKKKFHSACLYKWFQTSHNSTCPLCRNLF